jgi:hypothetical protein
VLLAGELRQAKRRHCLPRSGGIEGERVWSPLSSGERRSGDDMDMVFNLGHEIQWANPANNGAVGV